MRRALCGRLAVVALAGVLVGACNADTPQTQPVSQGGAKRSDAVVKVQAEAGKPDADGKQDVTLTLTIDKGWHLYANPVGLEDLASAQTTVTFSVKIDEKNVPRDAKVTYPPGKLVKDKVVGDYKVYEDQVTIKATVTRPPGDTGPLEASIRLQACNDRTCLLPATVKVTVP